MQNTVFVQQPDYIGFRATSLPLQALGVIYDGSDPYATPLGVLFCIREESILREIFLPRASRVEDGKVVYMHELSSARYVFSRNGFEIAQVQLSDSPVSPESKSFLRQYMEAQSAKIPGGKYVLEVSG